MAEEVRTLDKKRDNESEGIGEFIRKTSEEVDKTTFPSSEDVRNTTIVVLISVVFFTIYLFLIDKVWVFLLDGLTALVNKLVGI